jgi:hypothetical protein
MQPPPLPLLEVPLLAEDPLQEQAPFWQVAP